MRYGYGKGYMVIIPRWMYAKISDNFVGYVKILFFSKFQDLSK